MCGIAFDPINRVIERMARVRGASVAAVRAALVDYAEMAEDRGDISALDIETIAVWTGIKEVKIEAILSALRAKGVIVGTRLAGWERVTQVASSYRRKRDLANARQRAHTARKRAEAAEIQARRSVASPSVTASPDPVLSFLSSKEVQEENKQTPRARGDAASDALNAELAEIRAFWPVDNLGPIAVDEREYRRYRLRYTAEQIITAARAYIDGKPDWRSARYIANWLHTNPCREQRLLPLGSKPVEVSASAAPRPPRDNWVAILTEARATGRWREEWGPPPGQPGCRAPPAETGIGYAIAKWFREHGAQEQRVSA